MAPFYSSGRGLHASAPFAQDVGGSAKGGRFRRIYGGASLRPLSELPLDRCPIPCGSGQWRGMGRSRDQGSMHRFPIHRDARKPCGDRGLDHFGYRINGTQTTEVLMPTFSVIPHRCQKSRGVPAPSNPCHDGAPPQWVNRIFDVHRIGMQKITKAHPYRNALGRARILNGPSLTRASCDNSRLQRPRDVRDGLIGR